MKFKYYDSDYCSIELEASNRADKELLQAMYLKFIQNPNEVSNLLKKCIDGDVE